MWLESTSIWAVRKAFLCRDLKHGKILTTLVRGVKVPVTCKIRILPNIEDTIALVKCIEKCGISAIAVHGRTKEETPQHPNHNDVIRLISKAVSVPVIANGGSRQISNWSDLDRFKKETEASSVMVAQAALLNPSIFRSAGVLPIEDVISAYLKLRCQYDANPAFVKYTLQLFLQHCLHTTESGHRLLGAKSLKEICQIWNLEDYYNRQKELHKKRRVRTAQILNENKVGAFAEEYSMATDVVQFPVSFVRNHYANNNLVPRMILYNYAKQHLLDTPVYITTACGKYFMSIVCLSGYKFASSIRGKSKKYAEQSSALAALIALDLTYLLPQLALENIPLNELN